MKWTPLPWQAREGLSAKRVRWDKGGVSKAPISTDSEQQRRRGCQAATAPPTSTGPPRKPGPARHRRDGGRRGPPTSARVQSDPFALRRWVWPPPSPTPSGAGWRRRAAAATQRDRHRGDRHSPRITKDRWPGGTNQDLRLRWRFVWGSGWCDASSHGKGAPGNRRATAGTLGPGHPSI